MRTLDGEKIDDVKTILDDATISASEKIKSLRETLDMDKELEFFTVDAIMNDKSLQIEERGDLTKKVMESLLWWRRWNLLGELLRPYSNKEISEWVEYEQDILWTPTLEDNPVWTEHLPEYDGKTFKPSVNYSPVTDKKD